MRKCTHTHMYTPPLSFLVCKVISIEHYWVPVKKTFSFLEGRRMVGPHTDMILNKLNVLPFSENEGLMQKKCSHHAFCLFSLLDFFSFI